MCDYEGYEFGGGYIDSTCIDGYLWDLDSSDGDYLTHGGDIPCPKCNSGKFLDFIKEDIETGVSPRDNGIDILKASIHKVSILDVDALYSWYEKNPIVRVLKWDESTVKVSVLELLPM